MLINTNQLISLVDLRNKAGDVMQKTKSGMIFYVTDKGQLMGMISPIPTQTKTGPFDRIGVLREKMAKVKFTDNRDSTEVIREMRDTRYGS